MNINLNLYKYFYKVAYYGSYTKASQELMISQPSLSYSVKVLENQLDKKLFFRSNKGIQLTKYGKELFEKLKTIFNELESITDNSKEISGKIILGVRSAFAYNALPFYLRELNKVYPNLQIDYIIARSSKMLDLLKNNEVDIIIDEYEYDVDYFNVKFDYCYESVFFTSSDNYKIIKSINLNNINNYNICVVENNRISKELENEYPNCKYIKVLSTPIMIDTVKNINTIGISSLAFINNILEKGDYVKLDSDIQLPKLNVYATYKEKNNNIMAVLTFFQEHFGNYAESLKNK